MRNWAEATRALCPCALEIRQGTKAGSQNPGKLNPEHSWQGAAPPAARGLYSRQRGQLTARVLLQHSLTPSHGGLSTEMLQHLPPATRQAQDCWDFGNAALSEHRGCP